MLVGLFRNGLLHQIFPKAAGIMKSGRTDRLFYKHENLDHLNVDRLSDDVFKMLRKLNQDLRMPEWVTLRLQMSERLDKIARSDFHEKSRKINAAQRKQRKFT